MELDPCRQELHSPRRALSCATPLDVECLPARRRKLAWITLHGIPGTPSRRATTSVWSISRNELGLTMRLTSKTKTPTGLRQCPCRGKRACSIKGALPPTGLDDTKILPDELQDLSPQCKPDSEKGFGRDESRSRSAIRVAETCTEH